MSADATLEAASPAAAARARTLRRVRLLGVQALLAVLVLLVLFPLAVTLVYSLTPERRIFDWPIDWIPADPQWHNYVDPFTKSHFGRYFLNSFVIAGAQTISTVVLASMAGYGLAKFDFPGRTLVFLFMLSTLMLPFQVLLVPMYVLIRQLDWVNTYQGLIVPGLVDSFGIFLMRQFALSIPEEYILAARIDGAGELTIYTRIVVPMLAPAIAALSIFTFTGSWNQFLWPLIVVNKFDLRTVPLGMTQYMGEMVQPQWGQLMAASIVALLPILLVFAVAQKQFVQGAALTGLKG
jgi:multiple sugar transport system permease protein